MAMPPYMNRALEREGAGCPGGACHADPGHLVRARGRTSARRRSRRSRRCWSTRGPEARQRTFQISDWAPSQRTVSSQFYRHVQAGSTGAALVTTPIRGNSPGGVHRASCSGARDPRREELLDLHPAAVRRQRGDTGRLARCRVRFRLALPGVQRVAGVAAPRRRRGLDVGALRRERRTAPPSATSWRAPAGTRATTWSRTSPSRTIRPSARWRGRWSRPAPRRRGRCGRRSTVSNWRWPPGRLHWGSGRLRDDADVRGARHCATVWRWRSGSRPRRRVRRCG